MATQTQTHTTEGTEGRTQTVVEMPVQPQPQQYQPQQWQPAMQQPVQTQQPVQMQQAVMQQPIPTSQPQYYPAQHQYDPDDNAGCIYVCAILGFFIPLIGWISMCCFNCGSNLPQRKKKAFKILVFATVAGVIFNIVIWKSGAFSFQLRA